MKAYLRTFGCRANQYDTEQVRALLEANGATIVDDASDADVAVFNSCAVTSEAVADLRQGVRRAARARPALRTLIMGCASALDDGTLAALPSVDQVVAGGDITNVARALGVTREVVERAAIQSGARATLRVQDGCDEHCTFCATTLARGASRSREGTHLVNEAMKLAETHPEIVVTGIHIGTYGRDIGTTLGALMQRLVREVPSVRFRLTSVEATEVDEALRELLRDSSGRVTPSLHAPLQSGSANVLKRMGRHWYTATTYVAAIERLVEARPVFGLGADVIAGFPGETDADHRETCAVLEALPFTYLHVFPYSARPGTAAPRLGAPVPDADIKRRAAELRAIGRRREGAYAESRAGGVADVVTLTAGTGGEGLSEDYLSVLLPVSLPRRTRVTCQLLADPSGRLRAEPTAPRNDRD